MKNVKLEQMEELDAKIEKINYMQIRLKKKIII